MSKEVVLLTGVEDLGVEGEIVRVADGYARNYLLPLKKAALVTAATRRLVEKKQAERIARQAQEKDAAELLAAQLAKITVTLSAKTGDSGKLFGSITVADILAGLEKVGIKLDKKQINLTAPIRELGTHTIEVKAHADVDATFTLQVVQES
jgi:large subunit ribosomal protein L9